MAKTNKKQGKQQQFEKVEIQNKEPFRDGIYITFRGQLEDEDGEPLSEFIAIELIVPPLNLDSLKKMAKRLAQLGAASTAAKEGAPNAIDLNSESMETIVDALDAALKRNYRGVPQWLIRETVDVGNMADITHAFMDVSGLFRKKVEEEKKAMEAAAAAAKAEAPPSPQ